MENISFDTGQMLFDYFERKSIYRIGLAKKMGIGVQQIFYCIKKKTIDTQKLTDFSHALEHNFFLDMAAQMPETYTSNSGIFKKKNEEIAALKERVKILEAENAVLLRVLKV